MVKRFAKTTCPVLRGRGRPRERGKVAYDREPQQQCCGQTTHKRISQMPAALQTMPKHNPVADLVQVPEQYSLLSEGLSQQALEIFRMDGVKLGGLAVD
jgi:hypothetical protein